MALRDEIRREQKKLKGQGPKAYLSYFWTYYKVPTLVVIIAIVFVASLIKTLVTHKDTAVGLMYMNAGYPSNEYEAQLSKDLAEALDIDTSKQEITLMLTEHITAGGRYSTLDTGSMSKIMAYSSAGQLDAAIMDISNFKHYMNVGMLINLREFLTDEEIEALGDQVYWVDGAALKEYQEMLQDPDFEEPSTDEATALEQERVGVYVKPDPSTMEDPIPAGVFMTGNKHLEDGEYPLFDQTECVFAFMGKAENKENAKKCLEYFLN